MKFKTILLGAVFLLVLGLAAAGLLRNEPDSTGALPDSAAALGEPSTRNGAEAGPYATMSDEQGAVTVEITPLGPDADGEMLVFEVAMNTHSVDLGMDLAALATLSTDTGASVQAALWDAMMGGHHVSGRLSFPARVDGVDVLDGASRVTLTISGVDADSRIFTWDW